MPVLMNSRMNAWSRRSAKLLPEQVCNSRARSLTDSTADGISGTAGGFIRAIGNSLISLAQTDV
jgi:hypothetical protein